MFFCGGGGFSFGWLFGCCSCFLAARTNRTSASCAEPTAEPSISCRRQDPEPNGLETYPSTKAATLIRYRLLNTIVRSDLFFLCLVGGFAFSVFWRSFSFLFFFFCPFCVICLDHPVDCSGLGHDWITASSLNHISYLVPRNHDIHLFLGICSLLLFPPPPPPTTFPSSIALLAESFI